MNTEWYGDGAEPGAGTSLGFQLERVAMGEVGGGREEKPGDSGAETIDEVAARLATEAYYGGPAKR